MGVPTAPANNKHRSVLTSPHDHPGEDPAPHAGRGRLPVGALLLQRPRRSPRLRLHLPAIPERGEWAVSPRPKLLEKIAVGLRLVESRERAKKFFEAYLHSVSRSEDLVRLIVTAFSDAPSGAEGTQAPLVSSMARQAIVLTTEQSKFIVGKAENYWAFTLLAEDKGAWTPAGLAPATGLSEAGLKESLAKLQKMKLLAKNRAGAYFCPKAGALFRHPSDRIFNLETGPLQALWDAMAKKKGNELVETSYLTRASEAEIRQYFPMLLQALKASCVCARMEKGPDTAFFQLQVRARRVLPF